jgi:serine/threonine protein kinase
MREALRYCSGVAEAIAEAHRRGLVHADLKPENIMIPRDGRVRVVDFGLAKPAGNAPGGASGTPAYMAPERWRGAPPTGAIDIWAFGVTLYEMVTGRRPFPDAVLPHLGFAKAMPTLIGLPEAPWLELVRDCLAFDPVARPTADELVPRIIGQLDSHAVPPHDARSGVARRTTTSTSHDASQLAAAWGTGPRLLHPATSMLLDAVTGARDATEFRQEGGPLAGAPRRC